MVEIYVTNCSALFYRATGIPVSCYNKAGECEVQYPMLPDRTVLPGYSLTQVPRSPDAFQTPSQAFYGCISLPDGCHVIIGPVYNLPYSDSIVTSYMQENYIPSVQRAEAELLLLNTPTVGYAQFLDRLVFLHYCLNGEIVDPNAYFQPEERTQTPAGVAEEHLAVQETGRFHNTYFWEQTFYALIRSGNRDRLLRFLHQAPLAGARAGKMADTPLRQAKNQFIGTVTKVGMLAGVPGGLDLELTYQLIDSYARECECAATVAQVDRLYLTMALDFCRRLEQLQLPQGVSQEVYACMCYIRNHTNEPITLEQVANAVGRSVSYLTRNFRAETGWTVAAFITHSKLEDAADLLRYSDRSLAEISSYLGFSSQSYFQNQFKKQYGITPARYRREHNNT